MRLYKLTDKNDYTCNRTKWGEGVTNIALGNGRLCSSAYIHAYRDPILAILLNPMFSNNFPNPHLWKAEGDIELDDGTQVGCTSLTTLRRIELPQVTNEQRVRFSILAARAVSRESVWAQLADSWLNNKDQSNTTAVRAITHATNLAAINHTLNLVALAHQAINGETNDISE